MLPQTYECPANARGSEIVGCGKKFTATPDREGLVDCPHCGLWFKPSTNRASQLMGSFIIELRESKTRELLCTVTLDVKPWEDPLELGDDQYVELCERFGPRLFMVARGWSSRLIEAAA